MIGKGRKMEKHITLVAVLNIGFGVMGLLLACMAFLVIAGGGIISGDPDAMIITMIVASAITIFFIIISLPALIGGIGLLKRRVWAKILVMIIAVLDLFLIPIGTFIGVYTLWVLMNDETAKLFAQGSG